MILQPTGVPSPGRVATVVHDDHHTLVVLEGELDIATRDELDQVLASVGPGPVTVDLGRVEFLGGPAVGALLDLAGAEGRRGPVRVRRASPFQRRILRLLDPDGRLDLGGGDDPRPDPPR